MITFNEWKIRMDLDDPNEDQEKLRIQYNDYLAGCELYSIYANGDDTYTHKGD